MYRLAQLLTVLFTFIVILCAGVANARPATIQPDEWVRIGSLSVKPGRMIRRFVQVQRYMQFVRSIRFTSPRGNIFVERVGIRYANGSQEWRSIRTIIGEDEYVFDVRYPREPVSRIRVVFRGRDKRYGHQRLTIDVKGASQQVNRDSKWRNAGRRFAQISTAKDGTTWALNNRGHVFRWLRRSWDRVLGRFAYISVGSRNFIWALNHNGRVFRWNGHDWDLVAGKLKQLSAACDGTVWGVNDGDDVFRWNGKDWNIQPGKARYVSVGNAYSIWVINAPGRVFRWNGQNWDLMAGKLKQLSAACDGTVWGVNDGNDVFRWNGRDWDVMTRKMKQLSVGPNRIWGIDRDNRVFVRMPVQ